MPQATAPRIRDQVNLLRETPGLPFSDLLDADMVAEALSQEGAHFRDRVYTPLVTIWTFLTQVLSRDPSCRAAVSNLIAHLVAKGRAPLLRGDRQLLPGAATPPARRVWRRSLGPFVDPR